MRLRGHRVQTKMSKIFPHVKLKIAVDIIDCRLFKLFMKLLIKLKSCPYEVEMAPQVGRVVMAK